MPSYFFKDINDSPDVTLAVETKVSISFEHEWGQFMRKRTRHVVIKTQQIHVKDFCKRIELALQKLWKRETENSVDNYPIIRDININF